MVIANIRMAHSAKATAEAWPAAAKQAAGTRNLPSSDFATACWLLNPRCKSWGRRAAAAQERDEAEVQRKKHARLTALLHLEKGVVG